MQKSFQKEAKILEKHIVHYTTEFLGETTEDGIDFLQTIKNLNAEGYHIVLLRSEDPEDKTEKNLKISP